MEVLFLIFILDNNLQVVGTLSKPGVTNKATAYFNDTLNIDLFTGAETFSFETFGNSREAIHVEGGNYIALRHDGVYKLFQIIEVNSTHSTEHIKEAYCEMAGIELINEILRATNMPATNIKQALTFALQDTDYQIGYLDSSLADVHTIELKEPTKVYNFLQNYIVGLFGAEISFSVEIQGNRVVGKYVNCHAQRGMFNGVRFEYGQNVTRVKKSVDYSELATALVCQGKNGTTISSVEEADKPLGQDWIGDENAYLTYSKNGQHIFDIFKFDTESPAELLREARKELANRCTPKFKYEVDVELLGAEVNIGDTVYVVDNEFNPPLHLSARVSQLQICTTDPTQSKCVLSNYKEVVSKITDDYRDLASIIDGKFPIGGTDILDGAISSDKLQEGSVGDIHIQQHSIHTHHLTAKSITAEIIDAGQIYSEHIIAGAIKSKHLEADSIEAKHIQAGIIEAEHIKSQSIEAEHIKANAIQSTHIQADTIQSTHLQAGSISAIHLQANTITSGSSIIGEGAIGSAQISDLDASKINAGIIDTSKVTVRGENSNLLIKGNRLQVFDGLGSKQVERVSLGDVYGDGSVYGLIVRGADGKTVLMDENGVTSQGITDGSITNEKISDNSPISGNKLDINSVINRINEDGTEVIKGIKVQVGESNLDAELSSIKSTQGDQGKAIEDNKLSVKAMEDSLNLKVDSQTYQTDKTNMNSKLDKQTSELNVLKDEVSLKVGQTEIEKAVDEVTGAYTSKINEAKAEIKATTDSITQRVASTETTTTKLTSAIDNLQVGGRNILKDSKVNIVDSTSYNMVSVYFGDEKPVDGETYTISIKGQLASTKTAFGIYNSGGSISLTSISEAHNKNGLYTKTFTWKNTNGSVTASNTFIIIYQLNKNQSGTSSIEWVKLEKGTLATDWSPAPEDVQTQIDNQTTEINSTNAKLSTVETDLNGITSKVSTLETTTKTVGDAVTDQEARLKTAESKITDSAITNVVKQSQFIRDLEGNITEVESKYTELKQTVDGFDFTGMVTFNDLKTSGKTVIDAGNITTGYISGDRIKGGTISATDEINFVGGARLFGNTGAYGAGLTISASEYVFNSGEATFKKAVTMQEGLTVTGTTTSSTVSTNALYVYGSSSITGSASVGNSLTVGGNFYGMGNIAIARGSVYIPNHGSSTTSDFLRMGGGFIACTDAGGFHFIPSGASRSIAVASGSVYLPQAGGSHVVEHVRLGMGLIACPSSGTMHFLTAGGVATSLYAKNVIATQSISEVSTLSEGTNALDVVNNAVVVNTVDGFKFAGTKARDVGGEVISLTEDKDNNPAVSIDFSTSISTLWRAVQELYVENMKLKEELNSLK